MQSNAILEIGQCRLDPTNGVLLRDGSPVRIRAKTYALLLCLARNAGRVMSKAELLDAVWPETTVTDDTLTQTIRDLRLALGPESAPCLETLSRRGYLLRPAPRGAAAVPEMPLVAVLPFLSGDPQDRPLADSLAEDIIHGLGRYSQLRVTPRHAAFSFRPETLPPAEAAARLEADYFLEGTARREGAALRLSLTLCGGRHGSRLWGESFVLDGPALPLVSGAVPHRIVTCLGRDAARTVLQRRPASGTGDLDAYQHFAAGVALVRSYGADVNERAAAHFTAALAIDPDFALAHSYLALAEIIVAGHGDAPVAVLEKARERCERALALAPEEARSHWVLSMIRVYLGQHAAAELHIRQAVALNPCDPDNLALLGFILSRRGRADEAVAALTEAIRLNPLHPDWYHCDLSTALQGGGRYDEALSHALMVPAAGPWQELRLARCHAMLGNRHHAARHLRRALALGPEGWDPMLFADSAEFEIDSDRERVRTEIARAFAALDAPEA